MENERNPGKLIGIIEDKCLPGATLPIEQHQKNGATAMASLPRSKNYGKEMELVQRQVNLLKFLFCSSAQTPSLQLQSKSSALR